MFQKPPMELWVLLSIISCTVKHQSSVLSFPLWSSHSYPNHGDCGPACTANLAMSCLFLQAFPQHLHQCIYKIMSNILVGNTGKHPPNFTFPSLPLLIIWWRNTPVTVLPFMAWLNLEMGRLLRWAWSITCYLKIRKLSPARIEKKCRREIEF